MALPRSLLTYLVIILAQGIISDSFLGSWIVPSTGPVTSPEHRQNRKQQDSEVIVPPGQNVSLECKGEGNLSWFAENTQQIYFHGNNSRRISATLKYPPRRLILDILDSSLEDIGRYVCIANDVQQYDVYVYVFDTNMCNMPLLVPTSEHQVLVEPGQQIIIPCRAVHPNVNVTLARYDMSDEDISAYDPRVGFKIREAWHMHVGPWECQASYNKCQDGIIYTVIVNGKEDDWVTTPQISGSKEQHKALGDNACLECSVNSTAGASIDLFWRLPNNQRATQADRIEMQRTEKRYERKSGISVITTRLVLHVNRLQAEDLGVYSCVVQRKNYDGAQPMIDRITLLKGEGDFVTLNIDNKEISRKLNDNISWAVKFHSKPGKIDFKWLSPRGTVLSKNYTTKGRFKMVVDEKSKQVLLNIVNISAADAGNYILQGSAGTALQSINLTLVVQYAPIVKINGTQGYLKAETNQKLTCVIDANPPANVSWTFRACKTIQNCNNAAVPQKNQHIIYDSSILFFANQSGRVTCRSCNSLGCQSERAYAIISDVTKGEMIQAPEEVLIGDPVSMTCIVPKFNCSGDIYWRLQAPGSSQSKLFSTEDKGVNIISSETTYSWFSTLQITTVQRKHAGLYICLASSCNLELEERTQSYQLDPQQVQKPSFDKPGSEKQNFEVKEGTTNFRFDCEAGGRPAPRITWTKDGEILRLDPSVNNSSRFTLLPGNKTLVLSSVIGEDEGEYACKLFNRAGKLQRTFVLDVKQVRARKQVSAALVIPIIILCVLLLGAVVYLARRVKREKKKVRTLTAQDVKIFLEGAADSIDPDLGLDQQADLLPYNVDYEYPREHLKLGRQLGAGAFGRVVRGEAEAPLFGSDALAEDGDEKPTGPTIVAVKMVKPHAELTHLKALMTELKILIHVGKHLNVVNLLGACTTNLSNKELLVIVEYCRYGNLHSFLLRQRDDFLDQVDHLRDIFDFSIGSKSEPGRYQNLPMEPAEHDRQVAFNEDMKTVTYEPSPHYAVPGQDMSKSTTTDSTGAMSEHWTPKYRGDFKSSEISRVSTKDLVCWSYQVARGMEYLASRQIVHADLAARNLLLADNNVVKICDFGLARNLYKDANYLKKGDDPLPVKWMAIESIRDRVFSTQSDVWSFGIVLWELFTLAMQPYPGIPLDANFLPSLLNGYRMEKPQYCTLSLYRIVKSCWNERPEERPNFTQLVAEFGHILDENVKQLYLELNGPYTRMNSLQQEYQHMVRNSRMSKQPAMDISTKSQPMQHTSAMNDYQFPVPSPRKISIKDKRESDKVDSVHDIKQLEKSASAYINLSADVSDVRERNSDASLAIEDTPQGYMRMSPSTSKANKSPSPINLITEL